MSDMKSLIAQRQNHQEAVDEIESQQNAQIQRVLQIIRTQTFEGDTKYYYERDSSYSVLTGTHNWPQHFTHFEIIDKDIYASGIYYGSHGYAETETVHFPEVWLRCREAGVITGVHVAWDQFKARQLAKAQARVQQTEEQERAEFERLQEKYGVTEKSG